MTREDADYQLKLKCMEIVADEIISNMNFIEDMDTYFTRVRALYDAAWSKGILDWQPLKKGQQKAVKDVKKEKSVEEKPIPKGMKRCPSCGEIIPELWAKHEYTKEGKKCGHVFADEKTLNKRTPPPQPAAGDSDGKKETK